MGKWEFESTGKGKQPFYIGGGNWITSKPDKNYKQQSDRQITDKYAA